MKQFFIICAVISAALLVKGSSSSELDNFSFLTEHISESNSLSITDEQKKCIKDGIQKVIDEHPNLKDWFDDITATANNLTAFADRCRALTGLKQKICFKRLSFVTLKERKRLFGNLTEEQKAVIEEIKEIVNGCLKEESSSFSEFETSSLLNIDDSRLTEEQIKCIRDGETKVIEAHPNLKEWFDDIAATAKNLTAFADRCRELSGIKQKICFKRLEYVTKKETQRLFGNPSEEQKAVIEEIKEVIKSCLKEETESTSDNEVEEFDGWMNEPEGSLDVFVNSLLDIDNTVTDEQKKCIQDAYEKVLEDFPALKSWFDDIQKTFTKLSEDNKQCDNLTGFAKLYCKVKVQVNIQIEVRRLFGNVTEEQKTGLKALGDAVLKCFKSSAIENTADEPEFPGLRITEEQIECIKEGYKKVVGNNPELQEWFGKVEKTLKKLAGNAKECEALSGINKLRCYTKLFTTARNEIKRLLEELSDEQREILKELKEVVKECLAENSFF